MFQYYENAEECYAFLHDVDSTLLPSETGSQFESSKWFTRGWTLQELLAPSKVFFLSSNWTILGHKCPNRGGNVCHCALNRRPLNTDLAKITGIPPAILSKQQPVSSFPPQAVFQWAENRVTKRVEDEAYCLLGLFGISMIPNYGEKLHAWDRLAKRVAKKYNISDLLQLPVKAALRRPKSTNQGFKLACESKNLPNPTHTHTEDEENCGNSEIWRVIEKYSSADVGLANEISLNEIQKFLQGTRTNSEAKTWEEIRQELGIIERQICDRNGNDPNGSAPDSVASDNSAHIKSNVESDNQKKLESIASCKSFGSAGMLSKKCKESSSIDETPLQRWLNCREDYLPFHISYGGRYVRQKACNEHNPGSRTDEDSTSSRSTTASARSEASVVMTPNESNTSVTSSAGDYTPKGES